MGQKYRQRGYRDSERQERGKKEPPRPKEETFGPRQIRMPGQRTVSRCAQCGTVLPPAVDPSGPCPKCGFELHSCKQCAHFDTAARFECTQPIKARIPKKDARNNCEFYELRVTVESETSPDARRPIDARQAFENLFKK